MISHRLILCPYPDLRISSRFVSHGGGEVGIHGHIHRVHVVVLILVYEGLGPRAQTRLQSRR